MKKKICLIYTGGTIGMVKSEAGYVPAGQAFLNVLEQLPELYFPDFPDYEVIVFDPLLDSSDIAVDEWNKIGRTIAARYHACDGFVVLHGTDTMAYSASALSFMLENLDKPVIFTGAQIPLYEPRSDGRDNLITAMMFAASERIREVCIYFGGQLLRGNRSTKASSDQLLAFTSPNMVPLATAGISLQYTPAAGALPLPREPFRLQLFDKIPLGVLKVFPGIQFELFESIMTDKLKGVVLESFGTGNVPSARTGLLPLLSKAYAHGTVVVVCSQCAEGRVNLGTYAASQGLKEIGAADGADMTTEAALAKLYYLFSKGLEPEEVKKSIPRCLRGELTE
ncbi:MAG: type I asparaginase [Lachnospiraceae bacterium]|nr:type I asparaginase [Lachnospiraceae bacterium]